MAKILSRDLSRYVKRIPEIPMYFWYLCKCFLLFKDPLRFIWAYLSMSSLSERRVELRNGLHINLSEHPHDIVTVFAIFVREDYGAIPSGGAVVDIGANIGIFSLYAASHRAAKVSAYEPNSEAFQCLLKNIDANGLKAVVTPSQLAVTNRDGATVKFPTKASMYNAIITDENCSDFEFVQTISLARILGQTGKVDILKLDCEGAEYDILLNASQEALSQVASIRMEYHPGQTRELGAALQRHGFRQYHLNADTSVSGNVWYRRAA
jgi:FkbM family methyltransferase